MLKESRYIVLDFSIQFEKNVSYILSNLLDIDLSKSKSLGFSSHSLSFQQKLTLLKDINVIDKKDREKFDYFSSIRNQFAHNIDAKNFTSCFELIQMDEKLRKLYGEKIDLSKDLEIQLHQLFFHLYSDLISLINKFVNAVGKKAAKQGKAEGQQIFHEAYIEICAEYSPGTQEESDYLNNFRNLIEKRVDEKINSQQVS